MYRLSTSFPYLIARLGIRTGELFTRVARRDGLTLPMFRVLAALSEEERPLRLGELAARTSADLSTLSRIVAEMHRRGHLHRHRPEHDQRSLQVGLTEPGRALAGRYMPVAAHYEAVLTRALSEEQRDLLQSALAQLYANLDHLDREIADGTIDRLIGPSAAGAGGTPPRRRPRPASP